MGKCVRESLPHFVAPMLLRAAAEAPSEAGWALEVKWDGARAQARISGGRLTLRSRPGRDWTAQFPELAPLAAAVGRHDVVLDGELVCLDPDGRPDFARLRRRLSCGSSAAREAVASAPVCLMIFDLLHHNGRAIWRLPYDERRKRLAALELSGPTWETPRRYLPDRDDLVAARKLGLEGVVAKRRDAPYSPEPRRSGAWQKIKHRHPETLTITAWRPGHGQPDTLLLSRPDAGGRLRYAGGGELRSRFREPSRAQGAVARARTPAPGARPAACRGARSPGGRRASRSS